MAKATPATPPAPTGAARRRRRLSDEEAERRMLQAAMAMVNKAGLTVGLDHLSLEDVIRDADVPRSTVYRRWPYKDLFISDLLKELASGSSPALAGPNPEAFAAMKRTILEHLDWLKTPELRRALAGEILRRGALSEFETFYRSPEWRTYFALHATFLSLPDGDLRHEIQAALTVCEQNLASRTAKAYEQVTSLVGLRLRPDLGATFEIVATLGSAVIRGLVAMAPSSPSITSQDLRANPFGGPEAADWSPPALAMASIVLTFIEPDPAFEWNEARQAQVREALNSADWPDA
jgi:AcrR family transcriptional regulator